jgi:hypothetical protein
VLTQHGPSLRVVTIAGLPRRARHTITVWIHTRHGLARRLTRHIYGCAPPTGLTDRSPA